MSLNGSKAILPAGKLRLSQKLALVYLVSLGSFVWGVATVAHGVFPYGIVQDLIAYVEGHRLENGSLTGKIANDAGISPARHLGQWPSAAMEGAAPVTIPHLNRRRDLPRVYVDGEHREGYRAVFGAFDFEESFWGGILIDGDGNIVHRWKLSTSHLHPKPMRGELLRMYGLHLLPDGSVIFTQQEDGGGIVRVNAASEVVWSLPGKYHHTISPTEDNCFWTYAGNQVDFDHKLVKVSCESGEIKTVIDMADVRRENPFLHIFNLQSDPIIEDISHGNDIESLGSDLAARFAGFEAGDLLLSYRTQNLLFVLDPASLKVKWWRVGAWDRQHDPDWESDGTIVVFSNNEVSDRPYSDIVAIDPVSYEFRTVLDGEPLGFYSGINGLHEKTGFGTRIVTSTTQGWVFEVDEQNRCVFSFVNVYKEMDNLALVLCAACRLPRDYLSEEFWTLCGH